MNKINLFLLTISGALVACNHHEKESIPDFGILGQVPLPPHAPTNPLTLEPLAKDKINADKPKKQEFESAIIIPEKVQADQYAEWHPKEGDLVRAGELVMNLKQEKKRNPTNEEMTSYLKEKMAISSSQAHLILEELGLEE